MTARKGHELKQLQTRLAKAEVERTTARQEVKLAQKRESDLNKLCSDLQQRVKAMQQKEPDVIVSEHALVRYFERVLGYDLDGIRDTIVSEQARIFIDNFGSGKIPSNGFRIVVKDRVVVTVEA